MPFINSLTVAVCLQNFVPDQSLFAAYDYGALGDQFYFIEVFIELYFIGADNWLRMWMSSVAPSNADQLWAHDETLFS